MTTIIDTVMQELIETPLNTITVANGFSNDVSVLPGWMVHYANDLMSTKSALKFPAIAFQPVSDNTTSMHRRDKIKNDRVIRVVGAVSVVDRAAVNSNLNSLLYDVRKVVVINNHDNPTPATTLTLGNAAFNLPDSQDQYAFFELDITISYIEVLNP